MAATFPTRGPTSDAHKAMISQLLDKDDELRDMAREFLVLGMRETIHQLRRGDPATKTTIARALASTITKAITDQGEDDGMTQLRDEMAQMREEMQGEWMDGRSVEERAEDHAKANRKLAPKVRRAS